MRTGIRKASITYQHRHIILMTLYLQKYENHLENPHYKAVHYLIEKRKLMLLRDPEDFELVSGDEPRWKNCLRQTSRHLRDDGAIERPTIHDEGLMRITKHGEHLAAEFIQTNNAFMGKNPDWRDKFQTWLANEYVGEKLIVTEHTMIECASLAQHVAEWTPHLAWEPNCEAHGKLILREIKP